ncbi:hypothetical protein TRICHSKD4_4988 [Roseibium sp. TrichSKD4]|nr:hypothetical protein TRICHSKD4_4988 [Roseibium sp. TrichSKD4]
MQLSNPEIMTKTDLRLAERVEGRVPVGILPTPAVKEMDHES